MSDAAIDKLRAILAADQHHLASSLYDPTMSSADGLTYGDLRELLAELNERRDAIGRLAKQVTEAEGKLKAAERVIEDACDAVGHGWFTESETLAQAINVKCTALEEGIAAEAEHAKDNDERRAFVRAQVHVLSQQTTRDDDGNEIPMWSDSALWLRAEAIWAAKPEGS